MKLPVYNYNGERDSILNMLRRADARWIAPLVHGIAFSLTWILYWLQTQPLLDGPARWPFALIFFGDFPLSVIALGKMWDGGGNAPVALAAWGVFGTIWWYFIGRIIGWVKAQ